MNNLQIQVKSAQLNLEENIQNLVVKFSLLDPEQNEMNTKQLVYNQWNDIVLEFDEYSSFLLIQILREEQLIGQAIHKLQLLGDSALNEINLTHNHMVVGQIQIWYSNPLISTLQSKRLKEYLQETGLEIIFKVIFTEIMQKQLHSHEVFEYAAKRLREIGQQSQMQ